MSTDDLSDPMFPKIPGYGWTPILPGKCFGFDQIYPSLVLQYDNMGESFSIKGEVIPRILEFKFDAGTSRGILKKRKTFLVKVTSSTFPGFVGYGEAGPLVGLSVDDREDFPEQVNLVLERIQKMEIPIHPEKILQMLNDTVPPSLPSLQFALETALLDLINGGKRRMFSNGFFDDNQAIPINGLIWMGNEDFMLNQIKAKIEEGYTCIKIKIGAIDFEQECAVLKFIRNQFSASDITIRVDANGAFGLKEALGKLSVISKFHVHSIEQPIPKGNAEAMAELCRKTPVPIALDEELIGIDGHEISSQLLDDIQPQYIILKPTLLGGIKKTREWINMAEERNIGWWMTSALESNIGLNAIAQFTSTFKPILPQGLGTGQLYHNNFGSPLKIENGRLWYDSNIQWEL
ncbi:MAG: o-succinylbenzoate synthase [Cyclobacteriaceae bacterium]